MSTVISQKLLAEQLAASDNLNVEVANQFVTDFFAQLEAALVEDGDVRIKGLGRFFVEDGEIMFTPTDDLAEAVNAPFAFFSPMPLNDDELQEPAPQPQPAPEPEIHTPPTEPTAPTATTAPITPTEPIAPTDSIKPTNPPEVAEPTEAVDTPTPEPAVVHHYHHRRGLSVLSCILIFLAGLLVGSALGYLCHSQIKELIKNNHQEAPKPNIVIDADTVTIVKPNSVVVEKVTKQDTVKVDTTKATATSTSEKAEVEVGRPKRYDTVGGRVYLATLARKYYGHTEYWVYIFEANNLKHPDRVKPGKRLLIPYLDDVRTSADDAQNLKDAKQRGANIYASFKKK